MGEVVVGSRQRFPCRPGRGCSVGRLASTVCFSGCVVVVEVVHVVRLPVRRRCSVYTVWMNFRVYFFCGGWISFILFSLNFTSVSRTHSYGGLILVSDVYFLMVVHANGCAILRVLPVAVTGSPNLLCCILRYFTDFAFCCCVI